MADIGEYSFFSWSFSRHKMFQECLKMYFLRYYHSWLGWNIDAEPDRRKAYVLSKLVTLPICTGNVIHDFVAGGIQKAILGKIPTEKYLVESALTKMRTIWKQSKDCRAEFLEYPKQYLMLAEFYYGGKPSEKAVETMKKKIECGAAHFLTSKTFQEVLKYKKYETPDKTTAFDLEGIFVYAVPDLHYDQDDTAFVLVDWKTGEEDPADETQMLIYGLFATEQYKITDKPIIARLEYLLSGQYREIEIGPDKLDSARQLIRDSVAEMKKNLADPEMNIAHPVEFYSSEHDGYDDNCRYCNFRELCQQQKKIDVPFF